MQYALTPPLHASDSAVSFDAGTNRDRPRERLWLLGAERVDAPDLLAVILGTGTRGRSASVLAAQLLQHAGGVAGLARAGPHDLARLDGIGPAQAARVVAAVALGARAIDQSRNRLGHLGCAADVRRRLWPRVAGLDHETFFALGIDVRNQVLAEVEIARGHLTGVDVHPREVFRALIRCSAAAGVCVHNHPSGDPTPSPEDLHLTRRLRDVGVLIGIPIIDHVIIAERGFTSIAEWLDGVRRIRTSDRRFAGSGDAAG